MNKLTSDYRLVTQGIPSIMEHSITTAFETLRKQTEDLVKWKLIEKGFGHLVEGLEKRRFPKLTCVKQWGCNYYYADDDTEEGAFIIAIQDFDSAKQKMTTSEDGTVTMSVNLHWQDTDGLPFVNKGE